ncbi:50S ribosomal protein L19 [Membranihabitans maritimus]|uniref:50S ribosomal protein L19 n=1 Tax=Membranihabitans maritimus TaxID=2904244 RepID=UPI001F03078E|nr:50S ribosomal protein L19 [Membranihabitans maritimus]
MDAIKYVQEQNYIDKKFPEFKAGDNIEVVYNIVEGGKERPQAFRGDVLKVTGNGAYKTFTVRKISNGVGVERIFPMNTPNIIEIKVLKRGKVRRAKLYYLRNLVGKRAKIKEKRAFK